MNPLKIILVLLNSFYHNHKKNLTQIFFKCKQFELIIASRFFLIPSDKYIHFPLKLNIGNIFFKVLSTINLFYYIFRLISFKEAYEKNGFSSEFAIHIFIICLNTLGIIWQLTF